MLIRSPARFGISAGATTMQSWPSARAWRWSPYPERAGFEADVQPVVSSRQSLDRLLNRRRAVLDIAEKPDFSPPPSFCDRHCVFLFGDIESNKSFAILSHGPPSVHEARLGPPEQPSFPTCTKARATGSAREHDV